MIAALIDGDEIIKFGLSAQEDTPYFAMLGKFVVGYAGAESAAHLLARSLSGMPDAKTRIVFGGMRLDALSQRIRRMMEIDHRPLAQQSDIASCLGQLKLLGTVRHNLVHRFVGFSGGKIQVSDALTARSAGSAEEQQFTLSDFDRMRSDTLKIQIRLWRHAGFVSKDFPNYDTLLKSSYEPWRWSK